MKNMRLVVLASLLIGSQLFGASAFAAGQPEDGYPNLSERIVLYLTNRVRSEPAAFNPDAPYPPTHPLRFDLGLTKAARWQAQHIIDEGCWCADHSSCCEVRSRGGDDVYCAGPSTGCGVTSVEARVTLFSNLYSGENAAQGYTSAAAAIDGWISSPGHWENMNNGYHTYLGAGQYERGWVQVFGRGGDIPVAADGIHMPAGTSFVFGSTYHQRTTGGPRTALVIINGECHDLDLAYGTAEFGAFEQAIALEPGCHRYYFHFTDGRGEDHTYPTTGSFAVANGVNEAQCPFYIDTRPADTCSPSGQPCSTGETRRCYTGPWGTEGIGQCAAGSERCIGGQWTGECREQILPEVEEICGDGVDNTCSGVVDDGCPGSEPSESGDVWDADAADDGEKGDAGEVASGRERRDGSCAASGGGLTTREQGPGKGGASLVAGLAVVCYLGRRRRVR